MKIDLQTDLLKADGFTDEEIASIHQYLEAAPSIDNTASVVRLRGEIMLGFVSKLVFSRKGGFVKLCHSHTPWRAHNGSATTYE